MFNFRSKITRQVLPYLLLNPQAELYLNEMVMKFRVDRGNLVKKLAEWVREGILAKRKRGNLSLFQANQSHPLYKEWRAVAEKCFGLEDALRRELKLVKGVKRAFIFGSYAGGDFGPESDVDVLVVGPHRAIDVQRRITKLQQRFDRDFNVVDMSEREFNQKTGDDNDPLLSGSYITVL